MFSQNFVSVVGRLVSNNLEVKVITPKNGDAPYEAISGTVVLRIADKSEIEVEAFSKRYTSTGAESKLFLGLVTVANEHKSIEKVGSEELADVIKVTGCSFTNQDYKSKKDGQVKSVNKIKGQFFSRLEPQEIERTPLEAKFEVTGMIEKIEDKMNKGVPTGDKLVTLNAVEKYEKEGKAPKYSLTPVKLVVDKDMANAFIGAGFMVGRPACLSGRIVNIETKVEQVVKRDFGEDEVRVFTNYDKKNLVTGGNTIKTQDDICFDEVTYKQLVADRNLKISALENGGGQPQGNNGGQTNPFAQGNNSNPFNANPFNNPFA